MTQKRKRPKSLYQRIKENTKIQTSATVILPVLLGVVIVVLWQTQTLHHLFRTDTFTLPLLDRIGSILFDNIDKIWENVVATMVVALAGLGLGSLLGYGIAMLAALCPKIGKGGLSVIGAFASIPVVALAPVMNNWTRDISDIASVRSMVAKILSGYAGCGRQYGLERLPRSDRTETLFHGSDGNLRGKETHHISEAAASQFRTIHLCGAEGFRTGKYYDCHCKRVFRGIYHWRRQADP